MSKHCNGGALLALGMTFASTKNKEILDFIIEQYKNPSINSNEAIIHGACLGIGICGMGSQDNDLYEDMKNVLCTDQAVTGEAAALALGLIMAGSGNDSAISDLVEYGQETQHEKIIRSLGLAIAMINYGKEEGADGLIE